MNYKIVESHIVFFEGKPIRIYVVWDDNGFFRGTYKDLDVNNPLFDDGLKETLQYIAAYGTYIDEVQKMRFFPTVKKWSR